MSCHRWRKTLLHHFLLLQKQPIRSITCTHVRLFSNEQPLTVSISSKGKTIDSSQLISRNPITGHLVVLGLNGSGKSTLCGEISQHVEDVHTISFSEHVAFLNEHGDTPVFRALGGLNDSQDLLVRFGLTKLWHRKIQSLSTGEIRKVMLAFAISKSPNLIVLECPADGLDIPSRKTLKWVVGDLCRGLRPLLVSNISFQRRQGSQVILVTQRPSEELIPEFNTLVCTTAAEAQVIDLPTIEQTLKPQGLEESRMKLRLRALQKVAQKQLPEDYAVTLSDPDLARARARVTVAAKIATQPVLLETQQVSMGANQDSVGAFTAFSARIFENNENISILSNINWDLKAGSHYRVTGNNGAGKSTLIGKLLQVFHGNEVQSNGMEFLGTCTVSANTTMQVVSTDSHIESVNIATTHSNLTSRQLLALLNTEQLNVTDKLTAEAFVLGVDHLLDTEFVKLSQGEQKLLLISNAFAHTPDLLIFDEACQGLDPSNRLRVLARYDEFCVHYPNMCSIFITHHSEEFPDAITDEVHIGNSTLKVTKRV